MSSCAFDFDRLRRLSVAERLQFVEDLWDSIAQDEPEQAFPITPPLAAELDRRVAAADPNPHSFVHGSRLSNIGASGNPGRFKRMAREEKEHA